MKIEDLLYAPRNMEVLMTINQYAKVKNVSRRTVHRWIISKKVRSLRSPDNKRFFLLVEPV